MLTFILSVSASIFTLLALCIRNYFKLVKEEGSSVPSGFGVINLVLLFSAFLCLVSINYVSYCKDCASDAQQEEKAALDLRLEGKSDELIVAKDEARKDRNKHAEEDRQRAAEDRQRDIDAETQRNTIAQYQTASDRLHEEVAQLHSRENEKIKEAVEANSTYLRGYYAGVISEIKLASRAEKERIGELKEDVKASKADPIEIAREVQAFKEMRDSWFRPQLAHFTFPVGARCSLYEVGTTPKGKSTTLYVDYNRTSYRFGTCGAGTHFELGTAGNTASLLRDDPTSKSTGSSYFPTAVRKGNFWVPEAVSFNGEPSFGLGIAYPQERTPWYSVP